MVPTKLISISSTRTEISTLGNLSHPSLHESSSVLRSCDSFLSGGVPAAGPVGGSRAREDSVGVESDADRPRAAELLPLRPQSISSFKAERCLSGGLEVMRPTPGCSKVVFPSFILFESND